VRLLQPKVETRLIKVDKDLLLMNQLGNLHRVVPSCLRTLFESLVVHVRHLQILDLMLSVEVPQRTTTQDDVVVPLNQPNALAERQATPLLKDVIVQQKGTQLGSNLGQWILATVDDAPVNVVSLPQLHPAVSHEHCCVTQV
jgi:hypothetical protein